MPIDDQDSLKRGDGSDNEFGEADGDDMEEDEAEEDLRSMADMDLRRITSDPNISIAGAWDV
jgi:hypothetical protein